MKRFLALLLCLALLVVCFASCTERVKKIIRPSANDTPSADEPDEETNSIEPIEEDVELPTFKKLDDVFAISPYDEMPGMATDSYYVCAFTYQDNLRLRVVADMDEATYAQLETLDIFDENYSLMMSILLAPLPVRSVENLNKQIPSQEELDKFLGKTANDLFAAGYEMSGYSCGEDETYLWVMKGISEFNVVLDGVIEESVYDAEDFDRDMMLELSKEFPIKSITFSDLSYACLDIE